MTSTTPGKHSLARYSADALPNERREVHLANMSTDSWITAVCGQPLETAALEVVEGLGEQPCVACQLLSDDPDWETLRRLPGANRQFAPLSGA